MIFPSKLRATVVLISGLLGAMGLLAVEERVFFSEVGKDDEFARMGEPFDYTQWNLVWEDEFDYPNEDLDKNWDFQNGPSHSFVICSRWRENATTKDGVLYMTNRKENRGGQEWTSASLWTKKRFKYGYYECRYKYAGARGTNNSFWLMPKGWRPKKHKWFEVDINEGHYPNEINTNIHNWTDKWEENGREVHGQDPRPYHLGLPKSPLYSHVFTEPKQGSKVRFSSKLGTRVTINELRVFAPSPEGYPEELDWKGGDGLINLAAGEGVKATSSPSHRKENHQPNRALDGSLSTSWKSVLEGEKWLQLDFGREVEIGAIQIANGWNQDGRWRKMIDAYRLEVFKDGQWTEVGAFDSIQGHDLSKEWHTYGLMWSEDRHDFYFDGKLIRSSPNDLNHSETNIILSLALLSDGIADLVTDEIDGTSMKVDWVRYYEPK